MDDLFLFLMLAAFVSLIISLIKPSLFQKIFKDKATRGKLSLYFGGTTVLFFILFGIVAEPVQKTIPTEQANQEVVQQKQMEEDKGKYSPPIITIKSWSWLQKDALYTLVFSATWVENMSVNGVTVSGTGGEYNLPIKIDTPVMKIELVARNKYYSTNSDITISRPKTEAEIETEKIAEINRVREEKIAKIKAKKEQAEKLFSAWDGSLPSLVKITKSVMNNPDSFVHVETVYWLQENEKTSADTLRVKMTYRGTNAFGGVVTNSILVETDMSGNILKVLEG